MKRKEAIQAELTGISEVVSSISSQNVFTVPVGYFDQFPENCLQRINSPLSLTKNASPQQIPAGYFDSLAGNILSKIKEAESENVELPSFGKVAHPFTVPEGYFESLPVLIMSQVRPSKVISIGVKKHFFNYAAAAVITGLLGLSLFNVWNNKETGESNPTSYASMINETSLDQALDNINDNDIIDYLSKHGQDVNAALVASTIDENNLPATEDYLLDENTLHNFLTEKNVQHFNN